MITVHPNSLRGLSAEDAALISNLAVNTNHYLLQHFRHPEFDNAQFVKSLMDADIPNLDGDWYGRRLNYIFKCVLSEPVACKKLVLTNDEERNVFFKYNYAKWRIYCKRLRLGQDGRSAIRHILRWRDETVHLERIAVCGNLGLISAAMRVTRQKKAGIELRDICSIAGEALLRAVRNYDITLGYKFSTFGVEVIKNSIINKVRSIYGKRKNEEFSIDATEYDGFSTEQEPAYSKLLSILEDILKTNIAGLDAMEWRILRLRFPADGQKVTRKELATRIGQSHATVWRTEKQACNKIKAFILENSEELGLGENDLP